MQFVIIITISVLADLEEIAISLVLTISYISLINDT